MQQQLHGFGRASSLAYGKDAADLGLHGMSNEQETGPAYLAKCTCKCSDSCFNKADALRESSSAMPFSSER